MKHIFREPLLHLIMAGALLYGSYDVLNSEVDADNAGILTKENVASVLGRQAAEKPGGLTQEEKKQIVEAFIDDELLFLEAKRLQLDQDAFIRERLIQKARFYFEGQFVPDEIDENTLQAFYKDNAANYRKKMTVSFEHRMLNADGVAQIQSLLQQSANEQEFLAKLRPLQKRSFLSPTFENSGLEEIAEIFGSEFIEGLEKAPLLQWSGRIDSELGFHIVKVTAREKEGFEEYATVADKVKQDWIEKQRNLWVKQKLSDLREAHQVNLKDLLPDA